MAPENYSSSSTQTAMNQSSLGLPIPPPTVSNIKSFVRIELTYVNYLAWKRVFLTVLKSHNLLSLVDGTIPCLSSDHADYKLWIQCNIIAFSWINATLSSIILDTLLNYACETSKQAWDTLASLYLDQVSSSAIHLKSKFQNFKKGPLFMEDYLHQLHSIAYSLRAIGKPLTDDDLVTQALQGLPSSYRTFVSGLYATGSLPSFIALRPLLLTEEAHINANASEESNAQTALLASTQAKTTSNSSLPSMEISLQKDTFMDEVVAKITRDNMVGVEDTTILHGLISNINLGLLPLLLVFWDLKTRTSLLHYNNSGSL
uniref:Uncharacterized protein LOC104215353 n=1 Tax=Nicotiana sylvestris TaxID=4096 RepID=A0A1U7VEV5_NICSY|nr:PREDICTED: uncharacterized protein LOC104215353 [Nicotiana sylvestris]